MNIQPRAIFSSFLSINTHEPLFTYSPLNILIAHALYAQVQLTSLHPRNIRADFFCVSAYIRGQTYLSWPVSVVRAVRGKRAYLEIYS